MAPPGAAGPPPQPRSCASLPSPAGCRAEAPTCSTSFVRVSAHYSVRWGWVTKGPPTETSSTPCLRRWRCARSRLGPHARCSGRSVGEISERTSTSCARCSWRARRRRRRRRWRCRQACAGALAVSASAHSCRPRSRRSKQRGTPRRPRTPRRLRYSPPRRRAPPTVSEVDQDTLMDCTSG